ncbi:hypothetical protein [Pseudoalteromonas piscicida]|uniref:Peptidase C-terminal archaeal/bacterial domain-containing protein n=1 Tax=Pseudoalteromonas piscicida TaxID=43662 RepID=A0A2A5JQI8_PSEO7|nr:hypothetical protein [Pseudoalteromonas piscicida]PCK31713.1 hypothetical protein CEX98_11055 [Pseudoalteromonas piscicida]
MKISHLTAVLLTVSTAWPIHALEHKLTPSGVVSQFTPSQSMRAQKPSNNVTKGVSHISFGGAESALDITPVCPTLSTGNLYTINNSQPGDANCYHFEITERSKTTALLVDQSELTNVNLSILRHNSDDTYTTIGSSANAGNQDEVVVALTEPGHYYWFMEVIESDGAPFSFGAAVATNLDEYEFNDTVASATVLPDQQTSLIANMDAVNDVDYFRYTAVRGQDTFLSLQSTASNEYIFEIYNNGWVLLDNNQYISLTGLQANQVVNFRVRANPEVATNPSNTYNLQAGSVASIRKRTVSGEDNVLRIPGSAYDNPYLIVQAYNKITWSVELEDSTGAPVAGATARLRLVKDWRQGRGTVVNYDITTGSDGKASREIDLGNCTPNEYPVRHTDYDRGYRNVWESEFEVGEWQVVVPLGVNPNTSQEGAMALWGGIGHICSQRLISSTPS